MRLPVFVALASLLLAACDAKPPTTESCAPLCAQIAQASAAPKLTAFERQLVDPVLEDIRAGVRPFGADSIGVCEGETECERFVGESPGELAPGHYLVQAQLHVPALGTWKVEFATDCTTTTKTDTGETTSQRTSSRTYDVVHVGTERAYRLSPLRKLTSPMKGGTQTCEYTLTAPHPDGDKVYKGSWTLPANESGADGGLPAEQ